MSLCLRVVSSFLTELSSLGGVNKVNNLSLCGLACNVSFSLFLDMFHWAAALSQMLHITWPSIEVVLGPQVCLFSVIGRIFEGANDGYL